MFYVYNVVESITVEITPNNNYFEITLNTSCIKSIQRHRILKQFSEARIKRVQSDKFR